MLMIRPIVPLFAFMAIDALGIVLAILAHTSALVFSVNIERFVLFVHLRIVNTVVTVLEAVAR